jgi:hypothetical protein
VKKMWTGILVALKSFALGILAKEAPIVTQGLKKMANAGAVDFEALVTKGLPVAIKIVGEEAAKVTSGSEKFGVAVTRVWQELQSDPKVGQLVVHDVHMLVQMAYRVGGQMVHALD